MKKIFILLLLISSFSYAQYSVKGTMTPTLKSDWVLLYKIEGARQVFVKNTKIKTDTLIVDGKKQLVGSFEFTLPKNAKVGFYRATYKLEGAGYVDFVFNKENVHFTFNPNHPDTSLIFTASKENILYRNFFNETSVLQQNLDSIQINIINNPKQNLSKKYKRALNKLNKVKSKYLASSKGLLVHPFINAISRSNASKAFKTSEAYLKNTKDTFFENIDFSDNTLLNSSLLVGKISYFIFYFNYSNDFPTQQKLHKGSIEIVMDKISDNTFKKGILEFLITQFSASKNVEIFDYIMGTYYNKLPESIQDLKFKAEKIAEFRAEVSRIAPDFTWLEGKKKMSLAGLDDSEYYLLVFWSTGCSHCLKAVPKIDDAIKNKNKVKIIAFALEEDDLDWKNFTANFPEWHHVLGLKKWENKTARTYNINSTPSYFILDKNKRIIAKPPGLEGVKLFFSKK